MSEALHIAAVMAALTAAGAHPYEYGQVPKPFPKRYTEVTVSRRFGGNPRATSRSSVDGWRVTTREIGKDYAANARAERAAAHTALEDQRLTVDGVETSPIHFETAEAIAPDELPYYSGLTSWTYTH